MRIAEEVEPKKAASSGTLDSDRVVDGSADAKRATSTDEDRVGKSSGRTRTKKPRRSEHKKTAIANTSARGSVKTDKKTGGKRELLERGEHVADAEPLDKGLVVDADDSDADGTEKPATRATHPAVEGSAQKTPATVAHGKALLEQFEKHIKNKDFGKAAEALERLASLKGYTKEAKVQKQRLADAKKAHDTKLNTAQKKAKGGKIKPGKAAAPRKMSTFK